jgi:hypothetical protein
MVSILTQETNHEACHDVARPTKDAEALPRHHLRRSHDRPCGRDRPAGGGRHSGELPIGPLTSQRSAAGYPLVVATVRNSGRRTLDIGGTLTLSHDPGGLRAGPFQVKLPAPLAPSGSETATVQLDTRLPRGPWRASIRLTSGALTRTSAANLTFSRLSGGVTGSGQPSRLMMIAVALLALAVTGIVTLRSRPVLRMRRPAAEPALRREPRPVGGWHSP